MTSPQTERQQSVLDLLQNLKGQDPLKKLFWTELNYDKVNSQLSRRGWGEQASSALADDPVLLARGGKDFHVIHARLKAARPLLGMERPVVSRLLQDHPYALFIFSNESQDQWHFLNVKYDDDVQKRRLFRRITIGPNERLRTASERLDKINLADAPNVAPNTIQKLHDDAFEVEPVKREFFREYGRIFDDVEGAIKGIRDAERKRLFTQRLFNRLMFVAFIQKKGWLTFAGSTDYLSALWKAHGRSIGTSDKNFYRDRLKPLFFLGLNEINRSSSLKTLIGDVPYLNGGLFDEDDDDKDDKIVVPDKALDAVLNDLFARFNFTVTESTPLDVEVAVDPEMLGKIFEELVTGRHETGSYYTPKPIVSFMCREVLRGYLEANLSGESKHAIERFVDHHNPAGLLNGERVLEALRQIKVCDPACGSGAYIVGMLHELLDLRECLFASSKLDARSAYDRKLEVIQSNVYGVDLDPFAVNIARLRLWLSLSIDYEGQSPPPLPNLDFKVESGDSVCSPNPSGGLELGFRKGLIDDFLRLKTEYLTAHHREKVELRKQLDLLRTDIATWAHKKTGFDWAVEFAEVFLTGGFDVVISNPPYVRIQELDSKVVRFLKEQFRAAAKGNFDLYVVFVERGLQLLNERGQFSYILPHKFFNAQYGEPLRKLLGDGRHVRHVVHFGDQQVFSAATNYVCLLFLSSRAGGTCLWENVRDMPSWLLLGKSPKTTLSAERLTAGEWNFVTGSAAPLLEKLQRIPTVLSTFCDLFVGLQTDADDVFILEMVSESASRLVCYSKFTEQEHEFERNHLKPFLKGSLNIRRYALKNVTKRLIFPYEIKSGASRLISSRDYADRFPLTWAYLKKCRTRLEARAGGSFTDYWHGYIYKKNHTRFGQSKLLVPAIGTGSAFAADLDGRYYFVGSGGGGGGGYGITLKPQYNVSPLYLLGLANSNLLNWFLKQTSTPFRGGYIALNRQYIAQMPIVYAETRAGREQHDEIVHLVTKIISAKQKDEEADTTTFEREIDEKVYCLYEVSKEDVALIGNTMS